MRLVWSVIDPRAWLHLVKLVNYYNYTHVAQLRLITLGASPSISPDVSLSYSERIFIGDRVRIGSRCHLWAGPSRSCIHIGDDVLFGPEVMLTAATYNFRHGSPVAQQTMQEQDIHIGNDVWLATRVIVLPGTRIGAGSIIAAGSVVKGDIPPMSIVAGTPGKVVSQRTVIEPV
jgi:acetyltransferase-like isoleucine patch superfamily enzyme